jgi:hypothetical protein
MSQFDPGLDIIDAALKGNLLDPPDRPDVEMDEAVGTEGSTEAIYWRLWIKGHETRDFIATYVKEGVEGTVRKSRSAYVPATWTIPPRNFLVRTIHDHLKGGLGRAHEGPQEWPVTRVDCRWKPTSRDEWFEAKEWAEKTVNGSLRLIRQNNPDDESRAAETWFEMEGTVFGVDPHLGTGHDTNYNDTMPKLTDIGWHKWRFPGQLAGVPFSFVHDPPFHGLGAPVNPNGRQWSITGDPPEPVLNWSFHVKESVATVGERSDLELYIRESFGKWVASFWNAPWTRSTQYHDLPDPRAWCQFLDIKIEPASIGVYEDAPEDIRSGDTDDDDDDGSLELTYRVSCKWNVGREMMGKPFLQNAFRPILSGHVVTQSGIHEYESLCIQMHRIDSVRARAEDLPSFFSGWRQYWMRNLWPRLSRDQYNQWKCRLIGVSALGRTVVQQAIHRHNTDEERDRVRIEFNHNRNRETTILHWRFWIKNALEDKLEFELHVRRIFRERVRAVSDDAQVISDAGHTFSCLYTTHFTNPRAKIRGMTRVDCWWIVNRRDAIPLLTSGLLGDASTRSLQETVAEMSRIFEIENVLMADGDQPTWRAEPAESVTTVPPEYDNPAAYEAWRCDLSKVHR